MATDNTPPRLRLIVTIAIIVVITLVGLDFVFKSYYAFMTDEARREKLAPTTERTSQIAAEQAAFSGGKMPMEQAVAQLKASRGDLIEPKPSDDVGAMTGWSKLPKQAPLPVLGAGHGASHTGDAPAADAGAPSADGGALTADGGALTADGGGLTADRGAARADAGAAPTATDAGAPKPNSANKEQGSTRPAPQH